MLNITNTTLAGLRSELIKLLLLRSREIGSEEIKTAETLATDTISIVLLCTK
ncbi:hypothetical protein KIN20_012365 [Parelaphostrongylus tenuis]|uniref:Uncharacterized protein n=1 Tax=Parelaphostrongylus tenuis TaxID=148309 RepID=A0AAD5MAL9_PARTN|nr:hypothetical protein KIN20_012365 [Parelaphostrongylus tenuis]